MSHSKISVATRIYLQLPKISMFQVKIAKPTSKSMVNLINPKKPTNLQIQTPKNSQIPKNTTKFPILNLMKMMKNMLVLTQKFKLLPKDFLVKVREPQAKQSKERVEGSKKEEANNLVRDSKLAQNAAKRNTIKQINVR